MFGLETSLAIATLFGLHNQKVQRRIYLKNILFLSAISVFFAACGGAASNAVNNTNSMANANKPASASPAAAPAAPAATTPVAPAKPAGPKRIAFKKGEYSGGEDLTLAPGASATFVVGADNDQKLYIESSEKSGKIKITGGKVGELSNEGGYYDGITQAKGDVTFTITNPGKAAMKTKLSVTLVPNGD